MCKMMLAAYFEKWGDKMKRWVFLVLCVVTLCNMMVTLGGCSSEPVAFSDDLRDDKVCYMDVVEIRPDFEDTFFYCKCILADGSQVWMEILDSNYKTYFDTNTDEYDYSYLPNGVIYDAPVRLTGRAKRVKDVINNSNSKITVFRFDSADAAATGNSAKQPYYATPYSQDLKAGKYVSAEISKIAYSASVRTTTVIGNTSFTGTNSAIFDCTLTDGDTLTIQMNISDYGKYFEEGAVFNTDPIDPQYPDPIEFVWPVSIYGIVGTETVRFQFCEADIAAVEAAKAKNQPEVLFSDSLKEKQPVYMEIKSITSEYTVEDITQPFLAGYYVCRCETTAGETVWLYIYSGAYEEQFWEVYGDPQDMSTTITVETSIRVSGRVYHADSLHEEISEKTGADMVVYFSEIA